MWIKSYEKIFDEFLELSAKESAKEIFGNYMGIPDIYLESFLQMSRLWKKSYTQLCEPLNESMMKLSEKMTEISRGDAGLEDYKEFYTLWVGYKQRNIWVNMSSPWAKRWNVWTFCKEFQYLSKHIQVLDSCTWKMSEKAERCQNNLWSRGL